MNYNSKLLQRLRSSAPWALRHLLFSAGIVSLVAILVNFLWYPWPLVEISGGWGLLLLIFGVDVVCGPSLTLLLLHPGKSRRALWVDVVLISVVQLSALTYGIYSLSQARPIAIVYEVDRFRVVSFADIDLSQPEALPEWVNAWALSSPRVMGVRNAVDSQEKMKSLEASLAGVEAGQRPTWWQDYSISVPQVKAKARTIDQLRALNPNSIEKIRTYSERAAQDPQQDETLVASKLLWVPVVSQKAMDWVAFLDPNTGRIRGYVHANGFGD